MIGCVTATDDFEGQEAVDLAFVKGETIFLQKLVDENWGEGQIGNDRQGIFPLTFTNYAELRDIPVEQRPPSPNKQRDFSVGAQGTIVKNVKHGNLEIGDLVNVLSRDEDVFWVEDRKKNIIPVPYNMIELKTGRKSTEAPNLRNGNQQRQSPTTRGFLDKTKSTLEKKLKRASWSPDKSPILDLGLEIANISFDDSSPCKDRRERPKSVADVLDSNSKRRSYQEATEPVWEKTAEKEIRRDQPGRKSLKDLFKGKFSNADSKKESEKHIQKLKEQIERQEKERKRLEDRFGSASSESERTTIRNQLKMADSNLRRLNVELSKECPVPIYNHQRTPSAPVSMASSDESSQSRGEIQLQKSIEELRETEVDYVNDLWFILGRLAPEIQQDRDLLFGGIDEIHEFASAIASKFADLDRLETLEEQCAELAKLFLDEIVEMRNVYGPYCSRQGEASVKAAQLNTQEIDQMISEARRRGETKAFNMNSLLIKPVQRITKYPLLIGQIMKYAPTESSKLLLSDAMNEMKKTLDDINNQKLNFDIVDRYTRPAQHRQPNIINGLKKGLKQMERIKPPLTSPANASIEDPNDKIFNKEYQIATNVKSRIERFLEELKKLLPTVRAMCPESVLGAEFEQTLRGTIFFPLQEVLKCFQMPDTLVRKRSAKLQDYERMSKSDPRGASDAKQVFSALNAQLMAELPKLSALAESLFLSSVASLTYLVGQLLAKLNSQHPRPSSEKNHSARAKFKKSNDDLWLAIQKLDLISTNFNRPKPEPVLISSTQTPHDRSIIANQRGYIFQAKDRWVSGDRRDLKVSKGDLIHKIHDQVVQGKILVDNGSKKGYVPMRILSPISRRQSGSFVNGNSDSSEQLQTVLPEKSGKDKSSSALIDFETEADSPVSNKTNTSEFFINAKYDFTRRSDAELTVEEGERVLVVTQADADGNTDWWFVRNSVGKSGYVPRSYLVNEADI